MKTIKFKNKDNSLTLYALACGYCQRKVTKKYWSTLYMEHSHIHVVKGYKNQAFTIWECYERDQLTQAKKLFTKPL